MGRAWGWDSGVEDNEIIAICDCASQLLACYWHRWRRSSANLGISRRGTHAVDTDLISTLLTSQVGYQQAPQWKISISFVLIISNYPN